MLSFASELKCLWSENMERQADKRGFPLSPFNAMFWIFEVLNSVLLRWLECEQGNGGNTLFFPSILSTLPNRFSCWPPRTLPWGRRNILGWDTQNWRQDPLPLRSLSKPLGLRPTRWQWCRLPNAHWIRLVAYFLKILGWEMAFAMSDTTTQDNFHWPLSQEGASKWKTTKSYQPLAIC